MGAGACVGAGVGVGVGVGVGTGTTVGRVCATTPGVGDTGTYDPSGSRSTDTV